MQQDPQDGNQRISRKNRLVQTSFGKQIRPFKPNANGLSFEVQGKRCTVSDDMERGNNHNDCQFTIACNPIVNDPGEDLSSINSRLAKVEGDLPMRVRI